MLPVEAQRAVVSAQQMPAVDEGAADGSPVHLWGAGQEFEETFCPAEEAEEESEDAAAEELDEELEEESAVEEESDPLVLDPEDDSVLAGAEPLELFRESVR